MNDFNIDVNQIASKFGGGGHAKAAGAKINKPIKEAMKMVIEECKNTVEGPKGPELVLYQYPECPFCAMVLSHMQGLDIEIETKNVRMNPQFRNELIEATGKTQVPCLFIDGKPMFESQDIISWLESECKK